MHSTYIYNIVVVKVQHIVTIFLPVRLLCAKRRDSNVPSGFPGEELSIYITTQRFSWTVEEPSAIPVYTVTHFLSQTVFSRNLSTSNILKQTKSLSLLSHFVFRMKCIVVTGRRLGVVLSSVGPNLRQRDKTHPWFPRHNSYIRRKRPFDAPLIFLYESLHPCGLDIDFHTF